MTSERKVRYGIHHQKKEKLFYCLYLCGREWLTKQKWETRTSYQEALKRKAEIESQKSSNSFLPPTNQNIAEFLSDFVSLYCEKRWGVSIYDSQNSLIANYITPIIGDMKV